MSNREVNGVKESCFGQSLSPLLFQFQLIGISLFEPKEKTKIKQFFQHFFSVSVFVIHMVSLTFTSWDQISNPPKLTTSQKWNDFISIINRCMAALGIHCAMIYLSTSKQKLWKALYQLKKLSPFSDEFYSTIRRNSKKAIAFTLFMVNVHNSRNRELQSYFSNYSF